METLALALALNHDVERTCDAPRDARPFRGAPQVRPAGFVFITYAVEIEGDAPLYFVGEAIDD